MSTHDNIVLNVSGASKRFGGVQALSDVGIQIQRGQVYGLIGPNGAGKTTFFNVITGLYTPDGGSFSLGGTPYTPQAVHQVDDVAGRAQNYPFTSGVSTTTLCDDTRRSADVGHDFLINFRIVDNERFCSLLGQFWRIFLQDFVPEFRRVWQPFAIVKSFWHNLKF